MINPGKRPIRRRKMSYNTWANRMALKWGISRDEFESDPYDYRTYYKENYNDAQRHLKEDWHFPDTYKLPDHPTFSIDARASGKKNRINPKGIVGGEWKDDERGFGRYQLSNSQINNGWDIMRTIDYVENAEDNGVSVRMPNGLMPRLSNGDLYDAVLPTATVRSRHYAGGKDDDDPDNYPLYANGQLYLVRGNYTYDLDGNRVRFLQRGEMLPEAVVTPSIRQKLDHPLIWKDVVSNLYVNTPEEKAIRNTTPTTEALSAITGGAVNLNRLSASQNLRLGYDLLTGNFEGAGRGLVYGNSGLVSKKFEEEHPYWSMAINGATDTLGGLATVAAINRAKFPILMRPKSFMASSDGLLLRSEDVDAPDLVEQMYYKLMLSGEDANRGFPYVLNGELNDRVTKGLSPTAVSDLMHNTVERNLQTWGRKAIGDMPTAVADAYKTAAREALENVNTGRYPSQWYKKADKGNVLGFKTNNSNGPFISLREDLRPSRGIEEHEGEHLLNDMVAGVGEDNGKFLGQWYSNIIRNPIDYIHRGLKNALERGVRVPGSIVDDQKDNVRAAVRAIDTGTGFLDDIIKAAYDLDFLDIPKWVEKLKGYKNMASERVTTNRDARKQLFNRFNAFMKKQHGDAFTDDISSMPIEHQNELIDTLPDQWILDAVKNSNGYGQAYMHFLKKNKKITPEKIKLFREAMKYVGVYGVPLTVGATLFNEE